MKKLQNAKWPMWLLLLFLALIHEIPGLCAIVGGVFLFLMVRRALNRKKERRAELSGGFEHYRDAHATMKEDELLQILVQEEMARSQKYGRVFHDKKLHRQRCILTAVYILSNFVTISSIYDTASVSIAATIYTAVYLWLMVRTDEVKKLCKEVKAAPDTPISQVVQAHMVETAPSKKKWCAIGIAAFVLSMVVFVAGNSESSMRFEAVEGGYAVTDYSSGIFDKTAEVEIPESWENQPVVAIGEDAFSGKYAVETVKIPETVTHIGSRAFKDCDNLTNVQLPQSLKTLNGEAFMNCESLVSVEIPLGVTEIRGNTFDGCSALETVTLHDGIVDIHAYAFQNCTSLKSIDLPSGITEIHTYCFAECDSLVSIVIPSGVTRIAAHAFHGCDELKDVELPASLKEIRSSAFRECESLQTIEIPENTQVDERAFKDSPTRIVRNIFTDEEKAQILKEANEKTVEAYYCIYKVDDPDEIWDSGDGKTVLIADDARFEKKIDTETLAMRKMDQVEELLAYMKDAKAAGYSQVKVAIYSPFASKKTGDDYFVSAEKPLDEMIADWEQMLAEGNND